MPRSSRWYSMRVACTTSVSAACLEAPSATICATLRSNAASLHWARNCRPQRHCCQSSCGRSSSGASLSNIHLSALSGAERLAQGSQQLTEICPALAKLVSSAASGWRSTTVTSWPRSGNCQGGLMPMMPAPRTMVFIARSVRPIARQQQRDYTSSKIISTSNTSAHPARLAEHVQKTMSSYGPAALECLAAIVEEGGFERAAQRLNVTQSAVSQRLRVLEAQVGSVLIVRSRPLRPTPAGQLLLKHTKQLRLLRPGLERDLQELAPSAPGGTREDERIAIAINADSIATWAMRALHALVQQRLPLEIIVDDQDFTQEWLRSGQVLGCVTTLRQALRGCKMVPLGAMRYVAVAATGYAQQHLPQGLSAHNFRAVSFLSFNRKDDMAAEFVARAFGLRRVALNQLFVPGSEAQMRAVAAGWAVGVVPELLARGPVADGSMVDLAPGRSLPIALYWHCWNLESALLDALSAALTGAAAQALVAAA